MTGNVHLAVDVEVARASQIEASILSKRHITGNIDCGVIQIEETVARCSDRGFFALGQILLGDDAEGLEIESAILARRDLDTRIVVGISITIPSGTIDNKGSSSKTPGPKPN